jgi:hypothetical protein
MKRPFNLFDALFMMAVVFKLTGTGLQVSWPAIFLPYAVEGLFVLIGALATLFSWRERIKFRFWKAAMSWRVRQAGENAKAYMAGVEKAHQEHLKAKKSNQGTAGSNPGQFVDPSDMGKQ